VSRYASKGSENHLNIGISGTYRHVISEKFLLGVGAKIHLTNTRFGDSKNSSQHTNTHALFLTPGYAISDTSMLYGKLGVTSRSLTGNDLLFPRTENGTQYGLGVAYAFSPSLHLNVEYAYVDYPTFNAERVTGAGDREKYKTDIDSGTLSVGLAYRF
jgi:opacity protein-like surface antigen